MKWHKFNGRFADYRSQSWRDIPYPIVRIPASFSRVISPAQSASIDLVRRAVVCSLLVPKRSDQRKKMDGSTTVKTSSGMVVQVVRGGAGSDAGRNFVVAGGGQRVVAQQVGILILF